MIRRIDDFLNLWKCESEATLKVFRELTGSSMGIRVTPAGRSLGFIAWHITTSLADMMTTAGVPAAGPKDKDPMPATSSEITECYQAGALAVAEAVKANWSDAQLSDEIPMYGEPWARGFVLWVLLAHQAHHRGQMTVLMRQAGLKVPGVYGPAEEEWAIYGMPTQP